MFPYVDFYSQHLQNCNPRLARDPSRCVIKIVLQGYKHRRDVYLTLPQSPPSPLSLLEIRENYWICHRNCQGRSCAGVSICNPVNGAGGLCNHRHELH